MSGLLSNIKHVYFRNILIISFLLVATVSLSQAQTFDLTRIIASAYGNDAATYFEVALPYAKLKQQNPQPWVQISYTTVVSQQTFQAVAQVRDDGPNNTWDNYWNSNNDPVTPRVMFQNLQQWLGRVN